MEKKIPLGMLMHMGMPLKLFLFMRISFATLLLSVTLNLSAVGFSQENVSVSFRKARIETVLKDIEQKSNFRFVYSSQILPGDLRITLKEKDIKVTDLLSRVLFGTGLGFSTDKNGLTIIGKLSINEPIPPLVVKGKITDENGNPMSGVSITARNSRKGTVTDLSGNFSLDVEANEIVDVTYVGYSSQVIKINNSSLSINLSMQKAANDMGEVIVVGYGTTVKRNLTSAVSTIKTDRITTLPYSNMADALAGRAPGVITQTSGGEPGVAISRVAIRGGAGPDRGEPLYVIDNIVSSKYDFQNLQPQDIENVSILKDGSATAVYGSRAANGIILVTTRKGSKGKMSMNFNTLYELSKPIVLPKRINSYNYAKAINDAAIADGSTPPYRETLLDTLLNHKDPVNWQDNDWYALALRNLTPQAKYSLDMTGGSERTNYFLSMAYFNQGSNYTTDVTNFKRYNVRTNVTQTFPNQGITVGLNTYGTFTKNMFPGASAFAIWSHLQNSSPWKLAYNPDGTYAAGVDHPLVDIDSRSGYSRNEVRNMNANLTATWEVPWVKGLKAGLVGYAKTEDHFSKGWDVRAPQYDNLGIEQVRSKPSLNVYSERSNSVTFQGRIDFNRKFGLHNVNALALYEETENKSEYINGSRVDYISTAVDQLFAGSSDNINNDGKAYENGRRGYVGRITYDYDSRYILEGSFRYDGSDNFPKEARWGFFPSVSAGWVITGEKFASFLKQKSILDFLKIRGSFATVGNDNVGRFPYLSNYSLNQNVYVVGGSLVNGFSEGPLVDPSAVTWYQTKDCNVGFDFATLKNKMSGSVDYFYKRTTNFLTSPSARYTQPLGTSLPVIRSNSAFRRAGWEFQLGYNNKVGDLIYSISANTTLYNELWEVNANEDSVALQNPLTRSTHQTDYWGRSYINNGYYQSVADIINNPRRVSSNQLVPGDLQYEDVNGDGKIDGNDFVRTGHSAFPHLVYGFNLGLTYKAFSLDMLWQGTGTRSVYLGGTLQAPYAANIVYDYQSDYWTPNNTDARYPRQTNVVGANNNNNYTTSDFWLYNAKYLRLKSLRLAFDVKKQFPTTFKFLNSLIITANGTNLLTFSPVIEYFDPETSSESNYGYPTQKVFSFGLNIGF